MQMPLEGRHWYARIHAYVTCNVACHSERAKAASVLVRNQSAAKFSSLVGVPRR